MPIQKLGMSGGARKENTQERDKNNTQRQNEEQSVQSVSWMHLLPEGSELSRWCPGWSWFTGDPLRSGEASAARDVSQGELRAANCLFSWPHHPLYHFLLGCCASARSRGGDGLHQHTLNGAATQGHQQLLLQFILPESCQGVESLLPCAATRRWDLLGTWGWEVTCSHSLRSVSAFRLLDHLLCFRTSAAAS